MDSKKKSPADSSQGILVEFPEMYGFYPVLAELWGCYGAVWHGAADISGLFRYSASLMLSSSQYRSPRFCLFSAVFVSEAICHVCVPDSGDSTAAAVTAID
ncbi:MAG: hypothetical protein RLZZ536_2250 [Planctomycetota bacterium]|jgi:hypothetical protein